MASEPSARVIADSISVRGDRVTTMECVLHRFCLSEMNTHRVFSRNSASSRAIPFKKQLERVTTDPAIPLVFPAEQKGMSGGEPLEGPDLVLAKADWLEARDAAVEHARRLANLGVHKSVVNRLLEPFMWHTVVITATEWENFFRQRCSPLAQPEIQAVAYAMRDALTASEPVRLDDGQWHLPYVSNDPETVMEVLDLNHDGGDLLRGISAARCARVSYLTQDGRRDYREDLNLYERLTTADPPHWSPLEHVCRPATDAELHRAMVPGNLDDWVQLRHVVSGEWKEH